MFEVEKRPLESDDNTRKSILFFILPVINTPPTHLTSHAPKNSTPLNKDKTFFRISYVNLEEISECLLHTKSIVKKNSQFYESNKRLCFQEKKSLLFIFFAFNFLVHLSNPNGQVKIAFSFFFPVPEIFSQRTTRKTDQHFGTLLEKLTVFTWSSRRCQNIILVVQKLLKKWASWVKIRKWYFVLWQKAFSFSKQVSRRFVCPPLSFVPSCTSGLAKVMFLCKGSFTRDKVFPFTFYLFYDFANFAERNIILKNFKK